MAGICYDNMVNSRKKFKYELWRSKLISNQSETNKFALKLIKDRNNCWKVISNNLKKNNSSTRNNIGNEYGIVSIIKFCYIILIIYLSVNINYPYNTININDIEYTNYADISSMLTCLFSRMISIVYSSISMSQLPPDIFNKHPGSYISFSRIPVSFFNISA